jgi:hypothetical protein
MNTSASGGDGPAIVLLPENKGDPIRDSPSNPFLLSSKAAHSPVLVSGAPAEFEELPTISYVL